MSKSVSRASSISSIEFSELTLLQEAAHEGNLVEVKNLINSGMDYNLGPNTALHLALRKQHANVALYLLDIGCNYDSRDYQEDCPIHIACKVGLVDVVYTLCTLGCNVEVPNARGLYPLHLAARHGHINVVRCLCVAGCNLDVRNADNIRADITALKYGHNDIADLLDKLRATGQRDFLCRQLVPTSKPLAKPVLRVLGNCGVGKTALIKSLQAGLFSSLFKRSSSLQSNKSRPSSPINTNIEMDVTSRQNSLTFECTADYESTRGIHIQNLDINSVGEVTAIEFSGQKNYFPVYHHFLRPNPCTLTLILFNLEDSVATQTKQVNFWINFLMARETSEETADLGAITLVATHVDTTRAVKTQTGEWISSDAIKVYNNIENLNSDVQNLLPNMAVMDCNVPASYAFKQIKAELSIVKQGPMKTICLYEDICKSLAQFSETNLDHTKAKQEEPYNGSAQAAYAQYFQSSTNPYAQIVSNLSATKETSSTYISENAPQNEITKAPILYNQSEVALTVESKPVKQLPQLKTEIPKKSFSISEKPVLPLVMYGSDSENSESEEDVECPPSEICQVIEKMANYVAKNGRDFETIVKSKGDPRFEFLYDSSKYHNFYKKKIKEYSNQTNKVESETTKEQKNGIGSRPKEKKAIAPVSFSIKKVKEDVPKEIKSALPVEESDEDQEESLIQTTKSVSSLTTIPAVTPVIESSTNVQLLPKQATPIVSSPKIVTEEKAPGENCISPKNKTQVETDDLILDLIDLTNDLDDKRESRTENSQRDKIVSEAKEKLALQLERKRKAAAFLKLKSASSTREEKRSRDKQCDNDTRKEKRSRDKQCDNDELEKKREKRTKIRENYENEVLKVEDSESEEGEIKNTKNLARRRNLTNENIQKVGMNPAVGTEVKIARRLRKSTNVNIQAIQGLPRALRIFYISFNCLNIVGIESNFIYYNS